MTWEQQEVFRILKNKPGTTYQEADDVNKAIIRDWVKSLAQVTEIKIEFLKADGTLREMRCTLNPERIPMPNVPVVVGASLNDAIAESKKPRKQPDEHSLRVWDLDKSEWRSFRFDRLQKVGAEISLETK